MKKTSFVSACMLILCLLIVSLVSPRPAHTQSTATATPAATATPGIIACNGIPVETADTAMEATMDMSNMAMPTQEMGMAGMNMSATSQPTMMNDMGNMNMGTPNANSTPTVKIISPKEGDTMYGNHIEVVVQVSNLTLDMKTHLHVYLDGHLAAMAYTATTTLDNVTPGIHDICATVANANHGDLALRDGVTFILNAAQQNQ